MMGMADLVTCYVIKSGLEHLAANPDHCRYILGAFATQPIRSMVNMDHVNNAVELITKNRINVAPYYEHDIEQRPSVAIVSSGREEQMYIGDYGQTEINCTSQVINPEIYAKFDVKSIDKNSIKVPRALEIEKKIWIGVIVTNGKVSAKVTGILVRDNEDTTLHLDSDIPQGTSLKDWRAQSLPRQKGLEINSSMDSVTIQIGLLTTGQASVHRLLALVIRYCLKRGRQYFELYGLQVAKISYTPIMASESTELEYQTTFTIETMVSDSWIAKEFDLNDSTHNLNLELIAWPVDDVKNDPVKLYEK